MSKHIPVTDSFPDFSGRTLFDGRYFLMNVLGAGAYGKVYKALDNHSPKHNPTYVAVKCLLKPEPGSKQELFQLREFALHKQVSAHPNVVTFHNVYYGDKFVFVVLDFCDGGDLFTAITEKRRFEGNDQLIRSTFIQLIDAIHDCHEQNVFHRDIKPENVLCSTDGTVYIADFGLSIDSCVSKDFGCGSSHYMSPECIGKEVKNARYSTRHGDIWALGIILTNMITGRNPWRFAMTTDACFAQFLHDKDFLRRELPISDDAHHLLKRIFLLNPLSRISLPELREEILKLDTFFRSEKDTYVPPKRVIRKVVPYKPRVLVNSFSSNTSSDNPLSSPSQPVVIHTVSEKPAPPPTSIPYYSSSSEETDSSSGKSSAPVTPASRPVEPTVEVPDLPKGQTLGRRLRRHQVITFRASSNLKSLVAISSPRHRAPSSAPGDKPPPRRTQFIKRAVRLLKAISGSSGSS